MRGERAECIHAACCTYSMRHFRDVYLCSLLFALLEDPSPKVMSSAAQVAGQFLSQFVITDPVEKAVLASHILPLLTKLFQSKQTSWQALSGTMASLTILLKVKTVILSIFIPYFNMNMIRKTIDHTLQNF